MADNITEKYITGKGELTGFISLTKPSTKFNKKGVYSTSILLDKKEGEELAEKMTALRTEQFKRFGKKTKVVEIPCKPYEIVNEEDGTTTPDPKGRYILNANASAYIENGKIGKRVKLFNAKLQPVQQVSIGQGTIARLGLMLSGYSVAGKTGVSVKLGMVQIINLVEYSGGFSVADFDIEEGGFDGVGEDYTDDEVVVAAEDDTADDEEEADF